MKNKFFLISQDLNIGVEYLNSLEEELSKRVGKLFILKNELDGGNKKQPYKIFYKIARKLSNECLLKKYFFKYREKKIKEVIAKYKKIDYFLILGNVDFSNFFFEKFKVKFPDAKIVLYLWDKLEYTSWKEKLKYFNYIFSYDRIESKEKDFIFRPTFYVNECLNDIPENKKNDLYYIGGLREEKRYDYLNYLKKYLEKNKINVCFKLYIDKEKKKMLPQNYDKKIIIERKIPYKENIEILKNSNVVLDLKYKNQNGLTLRVYEAIGSGIKMITDNEDIINYDFYNENNIKVIQNISDIEKIDINFFKTPAEVIDEEIKEKYSVKGFLDEILKIIEN